MTMWQIVADEGARLKREQLDREIGRLKDPTERANLEHTFSKMFMFLEEDLSRALRIAANNPYLPALRGAAAGGDMNETQTVHDPYLNMDVEISSKLTDRLRGRYAIGPTGQDGEPEFGWRQFETPPIQHEAAAEIERLTAQIKEGLSVRLNNHLCEMKPGYDDSITGFNEAWDIMRKYFKEPKP